MGKKKFEEKLKRQQAFFRGSSPNETLLINWSFSIHLCLLLFEKLEIYTPAQMCDKETADNLIDEYLLTLKSVLKKADGYEDDLLPTPDVYFHIGAVTAAMGGSDPVRTGGTVWGKHIIDSWDSFDKLRFDPENVWLRAHLSLYQSLLDRWEGDFFPLPFIHRSPLDAAWGLRGDAMFYDFYDHPENLKQLLDFCVNWILKAEEHFYVNTNVPSDLIPGVWGVALPRRSVFVNADPVDLISSTHFFEFDKPYTEKLFISTGGGFYHHHAIGIDRAINISGIKNLLVQNIYTDINRMSPVEMMLTNSKIRDDLIQASLKAPVQLTGDFYPFFDRLIPILREGRFILRYEGDNHENFIEMLGKLNKSRNNKP